MQRNGIETQGDRGESGGGNPGQLAGKYEEKGCMFLKTKTTEVRGGERE